MNEKKLAFPFSQEIAEEHDAIRATMRWIESELARTDEGAPKDCRPLLAILQGFAEHLAVHFEHEERGGFVGAQGLPDSAIRGEIAALVLEHRSFEGRLEALIETIEQARESSPSVFAAPLCKLFADLRRHDALETVLLARIQDERSHR